MRRGSRRVEGIAIRIWIEARRRRATDARARSRARTRTRCCDASMSAADGLPISVVGGVLRGTRETSPTGSTGTTKHIGIGENIGRKVGRCGGRSRVI